jgi:N-acetylglucosaminyldiphosphoundecaprenol N-acetyl-beta-D-mannosaminyltransferase
MPIARGEILGTAVCASRFEEAIAFLETSVRQRQGLFVSSATTHSVVLARDDPAFRDAVGHAAYVAADGMPLVWILRRRGLPAERVHGDDLMLACCERFREWRHFLLGGAAGQAEAVTAALEARFPGIQIAGALSTPRRPLTETDTTAVLERLNAVRADLVWVGMGTPQQDLWMSEAAPRAGIPMAGVGSVFNLLAGRTRPAPEWMKRSGLQWLFRLSEEPLRLWRRYLLGGSRFVWLALAEELRRGRCDG